MNWIFERINYKFVATLCTHSMFMLRSVYSFCFKLHLNYFEYSLPFLFGCISPYLEAGHVFARTPRSLPLLLDFRSVRPLWESLYIFTADLVEVGKLFYL